MKKEENILNTNKEEQEFLKGLPKNNPYSVSDQYFETLSNDIIGKIKESDFDTEDAFPLLNSIGKEMPFSIPEGYFENLSIKFPSKEKGKVVHINYFKRIMVAASLIGLVFSSIALLNVYRKNDITAAIKQIKTDELINHLDTAVITIPEIDIEEAAPQELVVSQEDLLLASDEDLQDYINENIDLHYLNADI